MLYEVGMASHKASEKQRSESRLADKTPSPAWRAGWGRELGAFVPRLQNSFTSLTSRLGSRSPRFRTSPVKLIHQPDERAGVWNAAIPYLAYKTLSPAWQAGWGRERGAFVPHLQSLEARRVRLMWELRHTALPSTLSWRNSARRPGLPSRSRSRLTQRRSRDRYSPSCRACRGSLGD